MAHGHVTAAFPTFEAAADVAFFMTRADAANVLPLHRVADPVSPPRPCRFDSCARTGLVMKLHAGSLRRKRGIRKGIANGATCRFGSGRPGSADAGRHSRQPGNPEGRPRCVRQRRAGARLHRASVRRVRNRPAAPERTGDSLRPRPSMSVTGDVRSARMAPDPCRVSCCCPQ